MNDVIDREDIVPTQDPDVISPREIRTAIEETVAITGERMHPTDVAADDDGTWHAYGAEGLEYSGLWVVDGNGVDVLIEEPKTLQVRAYYPRADLA